MSVAVVDYGMGNLRSVAKAIEHVARQARVLVTSDPDEIARAERVVVPGQGAMPDCMAQLGARGLRQAVSEAAVAKPLLGICIGLQMLFEHSEEGEAAGLGILPGRVRRFPAEKMIAQGMKVPHMGWNEVSQTRAHPLWQGIADNTRFYFVHSYYVEPINTSDSVATTHYGIPFTSAVARDNIFAVQFHPEKSSYAGLQLLGNFMRWQA
jgi:glutamine amidotransferase